MVQFCKYIAPDPRSCCGRSTKKITSILPFVCSASVSASASLVCGTSSSPFPSPPGHAAAPVPLIDDPSRRSHCTPLPILRPGVCRHHTSNWSRTYSKSTKDKYHIPFTMARPVRRRPGMGLSDGHRARGHCARLCPCFTKHASRHVHPTARPGQARPGQGMPLRP